MKIALVSPYDYPYPGGVTEHIAHLDKCFQRWGHQVTILAPSSYGAEALGDNVVKVSSSVLPLSVSGSKSRITVSPAIYIRVKRALKKYQFDVVHLHEPMMPALPLVVLRHSHAANVGTFHAYREANHFAYSHTRHLLQPFFDKLDARIAVSEAAREVVAQYFPADYQIIPNGIDVSAYGPAAEPLPAYADGAPTILFLGRLDKRKGFEYLLRAFPGILEQFPNARLIVAGGYTAEEKEPYERYARQLGLKGVHFVGYISAQDKPRYYRSCDVFCAPSTGFESFGIVLLEAMASGKPIVASDIVGYRSVLEEGKQGFLVKPEDEHALAAALVSLLQRRELAQAMGEAGRQTARKYAWDTIAAEVMACYEEAIRHHKTSRERPRAE
ncbi:MAG: glycosyltransferase family 4 protein [Chloroflexi bacterium]|nr:glycosyltransferase family 4 protein [Chloroflexota bacterium]